MNRTELQDKLKELLGSNEVYYQPPESMKMSYPAIILSRDILNSNYANDKKYSKMDKYKIVVATKLPDIPVLDDILDLPYCSSTVAPYMSNGLIHYVFSIYI